MSFIFTLATESQQKRLLRGKTIKTLPYSYNYLREELGIKEEKEVSYTFEDYNIRNPEISAGSVIWELHCLGIREGIIKGGCSNIKVVG